MTPSTPPPKMRCRLITEHDLDQVTELLVEGFGDRVRDRWATGLARLTTRNIPDGTPRYGYCLDAGGRLQGVILVIATQRTTADGPAPFANVASWYVRPDYRAYAQLLVSMALKNKETSYLNVSAAPHTWPIVAKQGYTQYCSGLFVAFAFLKAPAAGVTIRTFDSDRPDHRALPEHDLLARHAAWGCRALVVNEGAKAWGLVLRRYTVRRGRVPLPAMLVIHAPDREALLRCSGNLGRSLLPSAPLLVMDANGPVPGLPGFYSEKRGRKFVRGPRMPALSDLADTEFALFGL